MAANQPAPFHELPVIWQSVIVDVESVAPLNNFDGAESYDVANMTAVVSLQVPEEKKYKLLLTSDVEKGTSATVRVMSTDAKFDDIVKFEKITKNEAVLYIPQLDRSGLVPGETPEKEKIKYIQANFKHAELLIPAGQQKIRIHASKKVGSVAGNPREFELVQFAPLLGFTIAGGQVNLALTITFPPSFEGNNMAIDTALVEPLPGVADPGLVGAPFDGTIGAVRAFAWHWRNDPRVKIKYRYQ